MSGLVGWVSRDDLEAELRSWMDQLDNHVEFLDEGFNSC